MTEKELDSYKEEVVKRFGKCNIIHSNIAGIMTNADKTGDRDAYKGIDWIDYWRAMTEIHDETLYCSSCGKEITNNPSLAQFIKFNEGDDTPNKHKAYGGHIWVTAQEGDTFPGGRYLTPLCPDCNSKRGKQISMRKGITLCKEVGANEK